MLSVVKLIRQLSQKPWDSFIQREGKMTYFGVGSLIHPFGENMLRTSHTILGLNAAVQKAILENLFYATWANISINDVQVGELGLVLPSRLPPAVESIQIDVDNSTTLTVGNAIGTLDLGSGIQMNWESHDTRLPSLDMFSAIVEGLTMVAPYSDPSAMCEAVPVVGPKSSRGQVVIDIQRSPNLRFLTCQIVRLSLEIVFERLYIDRNSWTTLSFEFMFRGLQIGHGDVIWIPA